VSTLLLFYDCSFTYTLGMLTEWLYLPGFDMGCETAGAYRGAGSSLNYLQTYSCQSRQLRSSRLIAVEAQAARADANVWV
jgi:hypothetical protein